MQVCPGVCGGVRCVRGVQVCAGEELSSAASLLRALPNKLRKAVRGES